MKTIHELMEWRFACKKFETNKQIADADLKDILDSARLTASSFGIQAWKFIVVTNKELREKLAPVCYNQPQITEASALVFFCAKTDLTGIGGVVQKYIESYKTANNKTDADVDGYKQMILGNADRLGEAGVLTWTQKQTYLAAQTLMMAAAEKGIDSCPMEGFDAEGVAKVLELPANVKPAVLVTLGYRVGDAPVKVRFPMEEVVEFRA